MRLVAFYPPYDLTRLAPVGLLLGLREKDAVATPLRSLARRVALMRPHRQRRGATASRRRHRRESEKSGNSETDAEMRAFFSARDSFSFGAFFATPALACSDADAFLSSVATAPCTSSNTTRKSVRGPSTTPSSRAAARVEACCPRGFGIRRSGFVGFPRSDEPHINTGRPATS